MATLPTAADQNTEYEDFYESTLSAPVTDSDTDFYPVNMPTSQQGFLVLDADGAAPEIIFFNDVGPDYVRCPSASDGEGRGVFQTTPQPWEAGTPIGMYSIAAFFEGIVTGKFMRSGFLEARHFNASIAAGSWTGAGEQLTYATSDTQKQFTYVIADEVADKYWPGMKLQLPRVTDLGDQSADFELSSSQYASKSSPANLSFTDDFTVEALIWVESLSGGIMHIAGRQNGSTEGFHLSLNETGQVRILGRRIASNNRRCESYLTVPLGRWVHVAATLDMSGNTGAIYIDGVSVPTFMTTSGTATALVQGTSAYTVAGTSGGGEYFDGKVADVRVWSTVRTANQIRDNYNKRMVGNETNLVVYHKLDGDFLDSTANANNLTGQNGAVATANSCPFSATEYAIITKVEEAGGNTTLTVFTGKGFAPAENITNASYSSARSPYGFPSNREHWRVLYYYYSSAQTTGSSNTWSYIGGAPQIFTPIGCTPGYDLMARSRVSSGGSYAAANVGLSTSSTGTPTMPETVKGSQEEYTALTSNPIGVTAQLTGKAESPMATAALVYAMFMPHTNGTLASSTNGFHVTNGLATGACIYAECDYV